MFKAIKKLFGSSENVSKVLNTAADGLYNGIDKLVYTEEEKAEALAKARDTFMEFAKVAYDQNSIRAVTRRWLAFLVVGPTMLFFVLAAILYSVSLYVEMPHVKIDNSLIHPMVANAQFLYDMAKTLSPWAGGVLIFYFGPHIAGGLARVRKD